LPALPVAVDVGEFFERLVSLSPRWQLTAGQRRRLTPAVTGALAVPDHVVRVLPDRGLMAMIMRAQLMGPDNHLVSDQQYNELFTMHGTIMLLLFARPLFVGLANEIMPLQDWLAGPRPWPGQALTHGLT
jgi:Cytochrome C and Quinol oxidase polypeptide I